MFVILQYALLKYTVSIIVFKLHLLTSDYFNFDYKTVCTIYMILIDTVSCNKQK